MIPLGLAMNTDCLVGPLLTLVQSGASNEEITRHLRTEIVEHFGLSGEGHDFTAAAERVGRWFDRGCRSLAEPVTIFVALLDEGADVWRPGQPARPLDHGLFRIVGVQADTGNETWQFPAGAIVRCEQKQFADGTSRMTAVEQAEEAG